MKIFVVAGEASGDEHAAGLITSLRQQLPSVELTGLGGPKLSALADAGEIDNWIEEAAVVGLWDVLKSYGYFRGKFDGALQRIEDGRPDLLLLVDYPGFNLRLAKAVAGRWPDLLQTYFISPQVWAWNRGRIPKMARWLDLMICIFPFEKAIFEKEGLKTVFGGHPLAESFASLPPLEREPNLIGLFPGSRRREVEKLFPPMIDMVRRLTKERPELRFVAAAASDKLGASMENALRDSRMEGAIEIQSGEARELMRRADAGMVASGTATFEATLLGMPYALVYKVAWPTYWVGKALVRVPFLGMANILAGKEVVKELIQADCESGRMADELLRLLDQPEVRHTMLKEFGRIKNELGSAESREEAGRAVAELLTSETN